jgi:hypothetical protein
MAGPGPHGDQPTVRSTRQARQARLARLARLIGADAAPVGGAARAGMIAAGARPRE